MGISFLAPFPWHHSPVHPHACGDIDRYAAGSAATYRFTPTRVGISSISGHHRVSVRVHPHACGDIPFSLCPPGLVLGSPPRVWGYLHFGFSSGSTIRFTPTRVGISGPYSLICPFLSVHPHACGDIVKSPATVKLLAGSPPRVWGYPRRDEWIHAQSQVHPHACGDILVGWKKLGLSHGSPPRVWGYRSFVRICQTLVRFTPTRVGISSYTSGNI